MGSPRVANWFRRGSLAIAFCAMSGDFLSPIKWIAFSPAMRRPSPEKIALLLALAGGFLLLVAIGTAILAYDRANAGEPYSIFNHVFSELGWARFSPAAPFLNFSLCTAAILGAPALWLLGRQLDTVLSRMAAVCGVFSAWACYLVGIFPLGLSSLHISLSGGRFGPHILVSLIFFWSWLVTVFLFVLCLWRDRRGIRRPLLLGAGLATLLAAFLFLSIPNEHLVRRLTGSHPEARSAFYWTATLEWSVVLTIGLWMLAIIVTLWPRADRHP